MKRIVGKTTIIVGLICVLSFVFIVVGINKFYSTYSKFNEDGHIITYNSANSSNKYYFKQNDKYKLVKSNVVFVDNEKNKRKVNLDNFVHYEDGDISVFKKSVVLDFNDLSQSTFRYYNIFNTQVLKKKSTSYEIDYLNGNLVFNNFMIKVSENKYLFVGSNLKIKIDNEIKDFDNNFIEVTFLDGDIVRICNDNYFTQNISTDMFIYVGDVKIDLSNQNVYYNDELKMNLTEATIDKDDNIVIPLGEDQENSNNGGSGNSNTSSDGSSNSNTVNGSSTNNGTNNGAGSGNGITPSATDITSPRGNLPSLSSGLIDFESANSEEIVTRNAKVKEATFQLIEFNTEINSANGKIQITDTESTLKGDVVVKVVETSTNKVVYQNEDSSGYSTIDFEADGLIPDTSYILVVNSDYEKNGVSYNKDFIQKNFITRALGVSMRKDFATDDSLSVNINKNNYSNIVKLDAVLLDTNGEVLRNESVDLSGDSATLFYSDLEHDTSYVVKLTNFVYSTYIVTGVPDITKKYKTLKKAPVFSENKFTIDKVKGTISLNMGGIEDVDNGITSYRYEIYDGRSYSEDATPVSVIERDSPSGVDIKIDGKKYFRGIPYVYKVITAFDDNEKVVEYESPISNTMMIDGVEFPSVKFDSNVIVTFERIKGVLLITDDDGTIENLDSRNITIIYTSSVGERNVLTSLGTLSIPIDVNNLRANETYTFSVYASVDLKDGNPVIDNCFIGSAVIKTAYPNTVNVTHSENSGTSNKTFSINAQLKKYTVDVDLEASTMTGIRFNLYSGTSTNGELVASVLKVDRNLDPYESTLKENYFDAPFVLDPAFFNLSNNDLYDNAYTIEVTNAYDYTDYKNEIPLVNNVFSFESNPYVPDYPDDPDNAVEFVPIRNGDYGNNKRQDLEDTTIVGYKVRAIYDNSRRYCRKIHYYLHDAESGEVIETKTYNVPLSQEIGYVTFDVLDGIEYNRHDDKFRRGGSYYINYTAEIDTNDDGTIDMTYPIASDGIELRSKTIIPMKQEPIFYAYPSSTTTADYTLKYYYIDPDYASISNKLIYRLDNQRLQDYVLTISDNPDDFNEVTLNIYRDGSIVLSMEQALMNIYVEGSQISENVFYRQKYSQVITDPTSMFTVNAESNRLKISFVDFELNERFYNRVVRYDLLFTDMDTSHEITMNNVDPQNGIIYVDYVNIADFIGHDVKVDVVFYYDAGYYGFDMTGDYFALQSLAAGTKSVEEYYYFADRDRLALSPIAKSSYFTYTLADGNKSLVLNEAFTSGKTITLPINLDKNGYSYNYDYISPKKISTTTISSDSSTFNFTEIVPGISLTNSKGLFDISPTINGVNFKAKLSGITDGRLKDNKIYVTIYDVDDLGNITELKTDSFLISDFDSVISIDGLEDNHSYKMKFSADVKNSSGEYVRGYLYDSDTSEVGREYPFKTSSSVGIDNVKVSYYNPTGDYNNRQLLINYNLSQLSGFQYITYKLERRVVRSDSTYDYVEIPGFEYPKSRNIRSSMSVALPIPVDCGVYSKETYRLSLIPMKELNVDGQIESYPLDITTYEFTLDDFYKPYIYVKNDYSSVESDTEMDLIVSTRDYNGVIVDNKYTITIKNSNGEDITPDVYKNVSFSSNTGNNRFRITGVSVGQEYTVIIKYLINQTNVSQDSVLVENAFKVTIYNSYGISTGTINIKADSSDSSKVILQFFETQKFDLIKKIRYSIYNSSGENIANEIYDFNTIQKSSSGSIYYEYNLTTRFTSHDSYYIQLQFLNENSEIVSEETIVYNYFE